MKGEIIIKLVLTAVLIAAGVCEGAAEEQTAAQFKEIEGYIATLRERIENHYAGRMVELQAKTDAEIRLLDAGNKGVYSSLAEQVKIAETVLQINGIEEIPFGLFEPDEGIDEMLNFYSCETVKKAPRLFATAQSRIEEARSKILADYEWAAFENERQKQYALNVRAAELEEKLKESVLSAKPEPTEGMITAIVHSKEKPAAVINGKVVHEKDIIDGVEIVRIYPDKINFRKKGRSWEQKVQEPPEKYRQ